MSAPLSSATLESLVLRVAHGDEAAFDELHLRLRPRLFALVLRVVRDPVLADDVCQEVFLDLWRDAARFDVERGSAIGWVMTVARHSAISHVRSVQAARERDGRYLARAHDVDHDSTTETVLAALDARQVRLALGTLTPAQQSALELTYLRGHTHVEMAEALGLPLGTAKSRVRDGLRRLRLHPDLQGSARALAS